MFQAALQAGRLFRGSLRSRSAFLRSQGIAEARGRIRRFLATPYDVFDWKLDYVNRRLTP